MEINRNARATDLSGERDHFGGGVRRARRGRGDGSEELCKQGKAKNNVFSMSH